MVRSGLVASALLAVGAFDSTAAAQEWQDPSAHVVRFIEVEPGVRLELLDWGGSGEPVLLLAGHGNSAHIFDEFAPGLTAQFHVFGLTRRGFGASARPDDGYDLTTLSRNILRVVDALELRRVHLIGHSIAGDEMTRFANTFPERLGKLVYLDAAYDRVESQLLESRFPSLPPFARPADTDLASPAALRAYLARTSILLPEAEIRATRSFAADGKFERGLTSSDIDHAVAVMVEHPSYRSIRAPVLAIYAVPQTPAQLFPSFAMADAGTRVKLGEILTIWQRFASEQRDVLRGALPSARVIEVAGGSHYVFISDRDAVLNEIRSFLAARTR